MQINLFPAETQPTNPDLEEMFLRARQQTAEAQAISSRLGFEGKVQDLPIEQYRQVWDTWRSEKGIKVLTLLPVSRSSNPSKPSKPYKPQSEATKHRRRLNKLRSRALGFSSFPDLWIPWMQEKLIENPSHFGVCQIGGDFCYTQNFSGILHQQRAITREQAIREQECSA